MKTSFLASLKKLFDIWNIFLPFYFVYFASENPFLNVHQFDAPKM